MECTDLRSYLKHPNAWNRLQQVYGAGDTGATKIAETLSDPTSQLEYLDLSINEITDVGVQAIAVSLKHNRRLHTLRLWRNNIGPLGAKALADHLQSNDKLSSLDLWSNNIGDEGAGYLSRARLPHITSIDLSANSITMAGIWEIVQGLRHNPIKELRISSNGIGDEGTRIVAEGLHGNATVTLLTLSVSNIGDAGAIALATMLERNSTLTSLSLHVNRIGDAGAIALGKALEKNRTLTYLDLSVNNIGNEGYASLRRFPININTNANPRIERGGIVDELYGIYNDAYNTLGTTYNEKCNVIRYAWIVMGWTVLNILNLISSVSKKDPTEVARLLLRHPWMTSSADNKTHRHKIMGPSEKR
ncbi:hypothetical protein PROFUN_05144 [Planoprotostelium fungivorum]|uniref:RNI-like protein n=1 Tax=Planoprotostelium fungivorum TaxID=1890364 RepID=A0A2P6NRT2_9EUKA|nr:hypothetical protein PROFUN_05144 [Planoprotostelium fungivorum]